MTHVAIIGGGPGGYEAALIARRLGAEVTIVDRDGLGGSTVLTDCVPSKTLIATSDLLTEVGSSAELGVQVPSSVRADLSAVNQRVLEIIADVRARGDAALVELTRRFDGLGVASMAELILPRERLQLAFA